MSEIRVDNILSADGTAAPVYSKGINVAAGQTITNAGDFVTSGNVTISGPVVYSSGATVTGVTTFNSDFNNINITGITTFSDGAIVTGVTTFNSALDNVNFTGISTFNNNVKFQEGLNVTGVVTFTDLSIQSGVTTFSGNVSVGGTLTYEDVTSVDSVGMVTAGQGVRVTTGGIIVTAGGIDVTDGGIDVTAGGINVTAGGINVAGIVTAGNGVKVTGNYTENITAVSGTAVDCSTASYFTKTITGATAFTFTNIPASGTEYSMTVELDLNGNNGVSWPTEVKWPADTAPTITDGKTQLFMFVTVDGGTKWRGGTLVDYTT